MTLSTHTHEVDRRISKAFFAAQDAFTELCGSKDFSETVERTYFAQMLGYSDMYRAATTGDKVMSFFQDNRWKSIDHVATILQLRGYLGPRYSTHPAFKRYLTCAFYFRAAWAAKDSDQRKAHTKRTWEFLSWFDTDLLNPPSLQAA